MNEDEPRKPNDDEPVIDASTNVPRTSPNAFVGSGILLFIDQLLVAAGGWVYWLVISRFASTSEIGHATTIYSLIILTTMIIQLGFEYPLLRRSHEERSKLLGTVLAIELAITAASIPIILFAVNTLYEESLQEFALITVGILVLTSLKFVLRFALLGISNAKNVLIFDVIGNIVKFTSGFLLVWAGFGTFGILVSFLLHAIIIACGTLLVARKSFGFVLGEIKFAKEIIRDALVNTPSKLSRMFIMSLSVVLLASFGVSSSDTGIFYIVVMVSIAAGGFASSMAFMVIPASSASKTDLSSGSMRLGLSFTAPVVAALVTAPSAILSLIGPEYVSASMVLIILSIGILPSVITTNTISRFNNIGRSKELLLIGLIQMGAFFLSFYLLVPSYGVLGAAYAMLIAFILAAVPSVILSERKVMKYIVISVLSISAGWAAGYFVSNVINLHDSLAIAVSVLVSAMIILKLGNTSVKEISQMVKEATKR